MKTIKISNAVIVLEKVAAIAADSANGITGYRIFIYLEGIANPLILPASETDFSQLESALESVG